ncbi:MAG: phosphate uptake regulator PhoU [Candidatus Bathyarchaeia archaeon]
MHSKEETRELGGEVRKVQITGKSTYIVSLPKKWVKSMNLRAGSQLIISEQEGTLVITPKELLKPARLSEAAIEISKEDIPEFIIRKIIALYLVGFSFIRIKAISERINAIHRNLVRDLARRKLVGVEIISDSESEIMLQILVSYSELSLESALRRMCVIADSMHDDALRALKEANQKLAQDVITLDDEVDRFGFYIIRQLKVAIQNGKILKEIGLSNPRDCLGYRVIVKFAERIADHAVKIAENVMSMKDNVDDSVFRGISEMSLFARSVFNDAVKSLYKRDYLLADEVISKSKMILHLEDEVMKTVYKAADMTKVSNLRMIVESIRRTAEYASDIAEIVLNLNVNQVISA